MTTTNTAATTAPKVQAEMTWQEMLMDSRTTDALDRMADFFASAEVELDSIESELQEAKSEIEASFNKSKAIAAEALAKYTLL